MNNRKNIIVIALLIYIVFPINVQSQGWYIAEDNSDSLFFKKNKIKTIKQFICDDDSINHLFLETQFSRDGLIQSMHYFDKEIHVTNGKIFLYDSKKRLVEAIIFDNLIKDTSRIYIAYFQDIIITKYKNDTFYFKEIDSSIQDPILIQTFLENGKLNTETYLKDSDTIIQYKYKHYKTSNETVTEISFDGCLYKVIYEGVDYITEIRCDSCSQFNGFFVSKYLNEFGLPYLIICGPITERIEYIESIRIHKYDANQRRTYDAVIFSHGETENNWFYRIFLNENGLPIRIYYSPNEVFIFYFKYEFYE